MLHFLDPHIPASCLILATFSSVSASDGGKKIDGQMNIRCCLKPVVLELKIFFRNHSGQPFSPCAELVYSTSTLSLYLSHLILHGFLMGFLWVPRRLSSWVLLIPFYIFLVSHLSDYFLTRPKVKNIKNIKTENLRGLRYWVSFRMASPWRSHPLIASAACPPIYCPL